MAKTYLDIINIALRDVNEVPLTATIFASPRGIQATVKEMTNRAYADILNYSKEWPFLSSSETSLLNIDTVEGTQEYLFPEGIDSIDWNSFYLRSTDGNVGQPLQPIDVDFYTRYMRNSDLDNADGGVPMFAYRTKSNNGFGLSPIPDDRGYTVSYAAWAEPTLLVNATDVIAIPERYYNVLISRVRYYLWMFRENAQQASFALNEYETGLQQMHRDLVEKQSLNMRAV